MTAALEVDEWSAARPGRTLPPVPIAQEAGWAPGPVWTGGKSHPRRGSIPDRPARSQSLYRLSYRAHTSKRVQTFNTQHFILVNLKQLHVSTVQGSHHEGIFQNTEEGNHTAL